ncbi:MAG TPA: glucose-6-phosphate isomerase [Candidatus Coprenecus stercoravium]|uniref:Glucose-6-phosphate isomerase n=1 Tax=Candidatus Coprenecus stercoravium TaxID=2840735 RepID=A0A9D2KAD3_9BACT|nr:glucose-6-phosphate isomerase [Candidatus Coprenecus stercoravium]
MIKVNFKPSENYLDRAMAAFDVLRGRQGRGNDFLGWMDLPSDTPESIIKGCEDIAVEWRDSGVEVVVVIGIGGSYLGAKAALEALSHTFGIRRKGIEVVFAGFNLSEDYHADLLDYIHDKSVAAVVISKSGTTTEPAVAFRIIKEHMERRYGRKEAASRIVAVTDKSRGALKSLSDQEGYRTFVIPDNVGGRFSVLTPVGLLPIAVAGYDIRAMLKGASDMASVCFERSKANPAVLYAAARNELYDNGRKIEILVNYNPRLQYLGEWWKQLFGESEGKEGRGIFPASVNFTTDLHSMGQYIQEGERIMFETVVSVENPGRELTVCDDPQNLDGLNFLSGMRLEHCNKMAEAGTRLAHMDGGVPNNRISVDRIDEYNLGELFMFFEVSCGISAYMLGVNPFDQPGVEAYKKNMFALLGKPGYEAQAEAIRKRLD